MIQSIVRQTFPFVGREVELAKLSQLLDDSSCRLLTLTGPGGVGKTRLALEAASQKAFHFTDGVYFVPLQPLTAPDLIAAAIANAAGFQFDASHAPFQQLLDYFHEKSVLLVLDNLEHLLDGIDILAELIADAPGVRILTTSRERLNLKEEWVLDVHGLSYPDHESETDFEHYSAVELFLQHAYRVKAGFLLDDTNKAGIARICRAVGGTPLALELAAPWVRVLSVDAIASEIERCLDILATTARNVEPRHRTVRAAIEPTWNRLPEVERAVFRKLSLFRGGFTREAAETIAGASLPILSSLVDKSLVRLEANGRYDVHELLRQYAEEQLLAAQEADALREAQSQYYVDFMRTRERGIRQHRHVLDEIKADFENVRLCWSWIVSRKNFDQADQMLESLYRYSVHHKIPEIQELFQNALNQLAPAPQHEPHPVWGRLQSRFASVFAHQLNDYVWDASTTSRIEMALDIAQKHGDLAEIGYCLWSCGRLEFLKGHAEPALDYFQQSLTYFEQIDDVSYQVEVFFSIGLLYLQVLGQPDKAVPYLRRCVESGQHHRALEGWALFDLGGAALGQGKLAEAEQLFQQALSVHDQMDILHGVASSHSLLGLVALLKGNIQQAKTCGTKALAGSYGTGFSSSEGDARGVLGATACLEENYELGKQLGEQADQLVRWPENALRISDWTLSLACCGLGDYATARHYVAELRKLGNTHHSVLSLTLSLTIYAVILAHEGDKERAVELLALLFAHPLSALGWLDQWPLLTRLRDQLKADLGVPVYAAAWKRGAADDLQTTLEALSVEPLETAPVPTPTPARLDPLTTRELEILRLIAEGLSNREIATTLILSETTVKWYSSQIYSKLGVKNRTQAIRRARQLHFIS